MTVARILREKGRNVVTARPEETLHAVIVRLAENNIGALVITDEQGAVCGIVSERDIVRVIASHGDSALDSPVSAHMTKNVRTCTVHDSLDWVMSEMTEHRGRHLPVIEDDRLSGVISIGDVVKIRIAECTFEAQALREYITA